MSTEAGEVLDNVEETDAEKIDTDFGLSAGAGEVLDSTEDTEIKETDVDLGLSVPPLLNNTTASPAPTATPVYFHLFLLFISLINSFSLPVSLLLQFYYI